MTRDEAIELARRRALNSLDTYAYLPVTDADAATWMPHEWVIDAIMAAAERAVSSVRPMADVATRLDAAISWLRDGKDIGNGVGLGDFIALRGLMRELQDADAARTASTGEAGS